MIDMELRKTGPGMVLGLALGFFFFSGGPSPHEIDKVFYQHRNEDRVEDQVIEFKDGRQEILYGNKLEDGRILYSPRDPTEERK